MKENLNMNYHEIARLLNRNERTIWTAYNKSKQKQEEPIITATFKFKTEKDYLKFKDLVQKYIYNGNSK